MTSSIGIAKWSIEFAWRTEQDLPNDANIQQDRTQQHRPEPTLLAAKVVVVVVSTTEYAERFGENQSDPSRSVVHRDDTYASETVFFKRKRQS
jgi:hypothetical protein